MKKSITVILVMLLGLILFSSSVEATSTEYEYTAEDYVQDFSTKIGYAKVDDRDVTKFPYSSIVYFHNKTKNSRATGVVVGRDYIVTAAHVYNGTSSASIIPALKSNNSASYGYFSIDFSKSFTDPRDKWAPKTANYHYSVVKVNPIVEKDGSETHIGDIVKPLTINYDRQIWNSIQANDYLSLVGYPKWETRPDGTQVITRNQRIAEWKVEPKNYDIIYGRGWYGGGFSGSPVLNDIAQVIAIYKGSQSELNPPKGHACLMSSQLLNGATSDQNIFKRSGLLDESSRIYFCEDKNEWDKVRRLINPQGVYLERKNATQVSSQDLSDTINGKIKTGYKVTELTDGVHKYDVSKGLQMPLAGGLTLYPSKYIANNYTVKYNDNKGSAGTMDDQSFTYGESNSLTANDFTKIGYTFTGWNTAADGSGTNYTDGESVTNLTTESGGTVTLYAQWKANTETAKVTYIDDTTNTTLSTKVLTGEYGTTDAYRTSASIDSYVSAGYELVSDNYPVDGVVYNQSGIAQNFEVHLKHVISDNTETKTVNQTIHYKYALGGAASDDYTASLNFTRTSTTDLVTSVVTNGPWSPVDNSFAEVTSPTIAGYFADKKSIGEVTGVTGDSTNSEETVTYSNGPVITKYVDEDGKLIADSVTQTGRSGDAYKTTAPIIPGYALKTTPDNVTGVYMADTITVTYVYKKVDSGTTENGTVTTKYVDEAGEEIQTATTQTGRVGDAYATSGIAITGYALKTAPENASGIFTKETITVTYVYKKVDSGITENGTVTTKYVDEAGEEIQTAATQTGRVGDTYATSGMAIAGYALKTTPENAVGIFTKEAITVTYVYKKSEMPIVENGQVLTKYIDVAGTEIAPATTQTGRVGDTYATSGIAIAGYTLETTPENASGPFTKETITVTYVYKKIDTPAIENGEVVTQYVDETGKEIAPAGTQIGRVGDMYATSGIFIEGYALKTTPDNALGIFAKTSTSVVYVYSKVNKLIPIFRAYNPNDGDHLYTISKNEYDWVTGLKWHAEGVAFQSVLSDYANAVTVYRLYNSHSGEHFYTTSEKEYNWVQSKGWTKEGIGFYMVPKDKGEAVYRVFNPNATGPGSHLFTLSKKEADWLISLGWRDEGISWYSIR